MFYYVSQNESLHISRSGTQDQILFESSLSEYVIRAAGTYLNMVRTGLFEMEPLVPSKFRPHLASLCRLI